MKSSIKTFLLAAALMASVTLTACGAKEEAPADNNAAQTETTENTTTENKAEEAPAEAPAETAQAANQMQFLTPEEVKNNLEANNAEYVFLDVRKAEDYAKGHVDGLASADLDGVKDIINDNNGDMAKAKAADQAAMDQAIANIKAAVKEQTGSEEVTPDKTYVLMCYSGKSYAQAGTDILINELGIPADKVKAAEGGMKAWEKAGQEYTDKVVAQ